MKQSLRVLVPFILVKFWLCPENGVNSRTFFHSVVGVAAFSPASSLTSFVCRKKRKIRGYESGKDSASLIRREDFVDVNGFQSFLRGEKEDRCDIKYGHACIEILKGADEFMNFLSYQADITTLEGLACSNGTSLDTKHLQVIDMMPPICVVRFSADWCKACKSLDVRYHKLAEACQTVLNPVEAASIRFADVTYKGNELLCDTLGIKSFPCIQVYKGCEGLLINMNGCKRKQAKKEKTKKESSRTSTHHNLITQLKDEINVLLEERRHKLEELSKEALEKENDQECMLLDIQYEEESKT